MAAVSGAGAGVAGAIGRLQAVLFPGQVARRGVVAGRAAVFHGVGVQVGKGGARAA